jgi:hypothetical protein
MDATVWESLSPALSRAEFELNQVPAVESAGELARLIPFDVILIGCSEYDNAVGALLAAVREPESRSRAANVLLFSPPAQLAVAEFHLARGADQALSTALDPLLLQETILRLLRSRPRVALRVMARLTVRIGEGTSRFICQTRDLSRSGMLAITGSRYPLGTSVRFALDLPDQVESVQGEAEVVRHAVRGRDADDGLGLRFVTFVADGERRLGTFLEKHSA